MNQTNVIVVIVVILLAVVVGSFLMLNKSTSGYCTCTGYGTAENRPPLNLWNAAGTAQSSGEVVTDDRVAAPGYAQQDVAYEPSMWSFAEANKTGCMCNYGSSSEVMNKMVPLSAVGATVPPGAVCGNTRSFPLRRGYEYQGYETAPATTHRYGSYSSAYNPDIEMGIM